MTEDEHDILVTDEGVQFVYSDDLAAVFEGEEQRTVRASHVEPFRHGWVADMTPSGGGFLFTAGVEVTRDVSRGGLAAQHDSLAADGFDVPQPFLTRAEALAAERAWLREHKGL